ncbi:MAG: DsbA family oxidoreductase [Chitinophagales bacterium]|nr:DsbA family oxidoreductase [Chitinophagales bacterium]
MPTHKMKVEIWSDVMCPFCYIGKRKFETALAQMPDSAAIEVTWKSFQLQPDLVTDTTKNTITHLAESKGWTMDYTRQAIGHVMQMAEGVGLHYNFDKAVVANSFDAHRLSHYATAMGKGNEMEEELFKAYFVDGKNTADHATLMALAVHVGLDEQAVKAVLQSDKYAAEVRQDIYEASQVGVSGVPFFVFNNKYAVSGAQDSKVFLEVLQKAYAEWESANPTAVIEVKEGAVCTPKGECK